MDVNKINSSQSWPMEIIEENKISGHAFGIYVKTLDLASYDSIGVYLQIRLRDFSTQISIILTSIAP